MLLFFLVVVVNSDPLTRPVFKDGHTAKLPVKFHWFWHVSSRRDVF